MKNTARDSQPAIDFQRETLLGLSEAARTLPRGRNGKRLHVSTLHRWVGRGLRGVVLETIRVGGRRYTSTQALQRFFDRLGGGERAPRSDLNAAAAGRLARAEQELDRRGV